MKEPNYFQMFLSILLTIIVVIIFAPYFIMYEIFLYFTSKKSNTKKYK